MKSVSAIGLIIIMNARFGGGGAENKEPWNSGVNR